MQTWFSTTSKVGTPLFVRRSRYIRTNFVFDPTTNKYSWVKVDGRDVPYSGTMVRQDAITSAEIEAQVSAAMRRV